MPGLRRVVGLINAQFTRAAAWLRPARTETLLRIDPLLQSEGILEDVAAANAEVVRVSLTQEELLWHTSSFKSNFTETNGLSFAHLPPAEGLLNLVDILCKDTSQGDQV